MLLARPMHVPYRAINQQEIPMSGTQPSKPSNIIAREFRGARLYLKSVHAGRGMRWLADKTKAAKFLMPEALTICERASREWGIQCAVLDSAGNLAQRINAPRFRSQQS